MDGVSRIIQGTQEATDAANYAEAIDCEMELMDGTDYKMTWTGSYSGAYPPKE